MLRQCVFVFLLLSALDFAVKGQLLSRRLENRSPHTVYFPDGNAVFVPAHSFRSDTVWLHFQSLYRISAIAGAGLPDSRLPEGVLVFRYAFQLTASDPAGNSLTLRPNRQLQLRLLPEQPERKAPQLFFAETTPHRWKALPQSLQPAERLPDAFEATEQEGAAKEGVIAPWQETDEQPFWQRGSTVWRINISTTGSFALGKLEALPVFTQPVVTQPPTDSVWVAYEQPAVFFRADISNSLPLIRGAPPGVIRIQSNGKSYNVLDNPGKSVEDTLFLRVE